MCGLFEDLRRFPQDQGPEIELVVDGDEHYATYERPDGYTVVYDADLGLYCFADLQNGQFVSTGIGSAEEPPRSLAKHLRERPEVASAKFNDRYFTFGPGADSPEPGLETFGQNDGLLPGRALHRGDVKGLTVLVNFKDVGTTITREEVDALVNGTDYREHGNFSSVREYFHLVSSGKLNYTSEVVGPVTLSHNRSHYIDHSLVKEALDLVVADGVDLSQFDSLDDGIVDAVTFLYAGESVYQGDLWPHNFTRRLFYGQVRTHFYMLTGLGSESSDLRIGTICHELGHMLCRFPDMYDYGKRDGDFERSQGIGRYCLMGSGNHLDNRRTPSPVCAYLRDLAGWCDQKVDLNRDGRYTARHADYDTVMKYRTSKPNEYFLIENRTKMGLDRFLPSSGLAIYHCDILGSNEWQNGSGSRHYQCALEQADGHRDLERNNNHGDGGDLFQRVAGSAFTHVTTPSSRSWDGTDSGLAVTDIGAPGQEIEFTIGAPSVAPARVEKGSAPDKPIPDNDPGGIHDVIRVGESGLVARMTLDLHIVHTWIGDLRVVLEAPTGRRVTLHNRQGEDADDIRTRFDSDTELSALIGVSIQGDWILRVSDTVGQDTGHLKSWSFQIQTVG